MGDPIGPPMPGVEIKLVDPDSRADRVAHADLVPFPAASLDFADDAAVCAADGGAPADADLPERRRPDRRIDAFAPLTEVAT